MPRTVKSTLWRVLLSTMQARFIHLTMRLPRGQVLRHDRIVGCLSGGASDTFNTVAGLPDYFEDVEAITALYHHYDWPASWWLPSGAGESIRVWLMQCGWRLAEGETAMVRHMDGSLPTVSSDHERLTVETACCAEDMATFGRVMGCIFEEDAPEEALEVARLYAAMAYPEPTDDCLQLLLGYLDGFPVATASLFVTSEAAVICDIATRPSFRRRGIATAMFGAALTRVHDTGVPWCTLQASADARPLYARQGFMTLGCLETWSLAERA